MDWNKQKENFNQKEVVDYLISIDWEKDKNPATEHEALISITDSGREIMNNLHDFMLHLREKEDWKVWIELLADVCGYKITANGRKGINGKLAGNIYFNLFPEEESFFIKYLREY